MGRKATIPRLSFRIIAVAHGTRTWGARLVVGCPLLQHVKSSSGATRPRGDHPGPNLLLPLSLRRLWRGLVEAHIFFQPLFYFFFPLNIIFIPLFPFPLFSIFKKTLNNIFLSLFVFPLSYTKISKNNNNIRQRPTTVFASAAGIFLTLAYARLRIT